MSICQVLNAVWSELRTALSVRQFTPRTMADHLRAAGAHVGDDCFIVPDSVGDEPYLVRIGNHVAIADGVLFLTHDPATWVLRSAVPGIRDFGPIVVEDNCFIGQRAIIYPHVRIGANSVVAAGSVVVNDVPPGSLVVGVPARPFGSLTRYREKCIARWASQRPLGAQLENTETWWNSRHFKTNRELLRRHLLCLFSAQLSDGRES